MSILGLSLLVIVQGGGDFNPSTPPFAAVEWSSAARLRQSVRSARIQQQVARRAMPVGSSTWSKTAPLPITGRDDPIELTFTDYWGDREGYLLYYADGEKPRQLPTMGIPLLSAPIGNFGVVPHNVVWYRLLDEGQTMREWAELYAKHMNLVTARWEYAEDEVSAKVFIRGRNRIRLPEPGILPSQSYNLHSANAIRSTEEHVGYLRRIGRVVFRAEFPELNAMPLAAVARRIERGSDDWRCQINPSGIPHHVREDFSRRVLDVAAPRLQQLDDESDSQFRTRTVLAKWQLELLQAGLGKLKKLTITVDGLREDARDNADITFDLKADGPGIGRLLGNPAKGRARLAALVPKESAMGVKYRGQLPTSLVDSLKVAAGTIADAQIREALVDWLSASHLEFFVSASNEEQFELCAAANIKNAKVVVTQIKTLTGWSQGQDAVIDLGDQPGSSLPRYLGFAAKDGVLFVGASNSVPTELLAKFHARTVGSAAGSTLVDLKLRLDKIAATKPEARGFDRLPLTVLNRLEDLWFQLCLTRAFRMNPLMTKSHLARMLKHYESIENVDPGADYTDTIQLYQHVKKLKFDPDRESFRHWLQPNTSDIGLTISTTDSGIRIRGRLGGTILPIAIARLGAIDGQLRNAQAPPSREFQREFEAALERAQKKARQKEKQ